VRRLSDSRIVLRIRGVFGLFFIVFGIVIIVRTAMMTHPSLAWIAPGTMGLALIVLGAIRVRMAVLAGRVAEAPPTKEPHDGGPSVMTGSEPAS
jgi:hypothetical protein